MFTWSAIRYYFGSSRPGRISDGATGYCSLIEVNRYFDVMSQMDIKFCE